MAHTTLSHRRTHNILLISRLLNQREGASPFTLVLDGLEQPARPLLKEYIRRSSLAKSHIIFLSFESARPLAKVDTFLPCWNKTPQQIAQLTSAAIQKAEKRCLLLIDSLSPLCELTNAAISNLDLTSLLMSLLQPPSPRAGHSVSMVAVYHRDMPDRAPNRTYSPSPFSILSFLATSIVTVHSLAILFAEKQAAERSLGPPSFGLAEEMEGILVGLKDHRTGRRVSDPGIVLQLEHRRKSGRGVLEWYFMPSDLGKSPSISLPSTKEPIRLLDDHPDFSKVEEPVQSSDSDMGGVTFELKLTERQRLERDGVVLPYFDAQKSGGGSEGGRILYDMGSEDDFDEEEDEI